MAKDKSNRMTKEKYNRYNNYKIEIAKDIIKDKSNIYNNHIKSKYIIISSNTNKLNRNYC